MTTLTNITTEILNLKSFLEESTQIFTLNRIIENEESEDEKEIIMHFLMRIGDCGCKIIAVTNFNISFEPQKGIEVYVKVLAVKKSKIDKIYH